MYSEFVPATYDGELPRLRRFDGDPSFSGAFDRWWPGYLHGVDTIDPILAMSEAELDALPLGIIRLDRTGKIVYYNQAQADLAQRTATTTVGLNFFSEVAPCTAVKDFQGRFNDFVMAPGSRVERFAFLFRFGWGQKEVTITMLKRADPEANIYIVVAFAK